MVEIITREFIQMTGSAGEVRLWFPLLIVSHSAMFFVFFALHCCKCLTCADGARESQDATEIHAHDEPGVSTRRL